MLSANEANKRLQLLRTTAYRSQYIEWKKLLHLHAAIMRKIETGGATWESSFDEIEKMVLENPGGVDWGSRLGSKPQASRQESQGAPSSYRSYRDEGRRGPSVWWCKPFQTQECELPSPHSKNIRGREVTVKHICARCFQKDGAQRAHPDSTAECPWYEG